MHRDNRTLAKAGAKQAGQAAEKQWRRMAPHKARIALASYAFEYGMTLDNLIAKGLRVPPSGDVDFSWGFFKSAKGAVYSTLYKSNSAATQKVAASAKGITPHDLISAEFTVHASSAREWDVFVSHASEDKESFARPLAKALKDRGLRVWFDEFTLRVGDSLRRSIDKGLAHSRYGIVVISPAFLSKEWPKKELDGLIAREVDGRKVVLPVWHDIDAATLRRHSPMLADRLATSSSKGLSQVLNELLEAMR